MSEPTVPQRETKSQFQEFQKLARLTRNCVITEKIDGTNAHIYILPDYEVGDAELPFVLVRKWNLVMLAGSRNRYVTPEADNYGFAGWCVRNADELFLLNVGRHYGEWWGNGIQRKYGLKEKRLSLFNTGRWCLAGEEPKQIPVGFKGESKPQDVLPACVGLVPVLYEGDFTTEEVNNALKKLEVYGSVAAPGFMDPEGIVVYHTASGQSFKKTIKNDESPKSLVAKCG